MSSSANRASGQGPFFASQLGESDRYELSRGHAIYCAPSGERHGVSTTRGAEIIATDPKVKRVGMDVGFSPDQGTLRAPDVSVVSGESPTWAKQAPTLALEFADRGQDEQELQLKIGELLDAGTRQIWVVRLEGPPRVEVYAQDEPVRLAFPGQELLAPDDLANPVPVTAFFDAEVAHQVALRNLLNRLGYQDLEDVRARSRAEGSQEGRREGEYEIRAETLLQILGVRGLDLSDDQRARILACRAPETLSRWILRALSATSAAEALEG